MTSQVKNNPPMDGSKRTWIIASSCAGGIAGVAGTLTLGASLMPSERAKAAGAPVEADISALKPGEKMTVEWRGKPVWILKRTPEQMAALAKLDSQLADPKSERKVDELTPKYARNGFRVGRSGHLLASRLLSHGSLGSGSSTFAAK